MTDKELIQALRENAEWAQANEWETPITLGDNLAEAADRLEALLTENERMKAGKYADVLTTIADRIRAMTDEELAKYLAKFVTEYTSLLCDGDYVPSDEAASKVTDELFRQLQQPYESPTVEKG